MKELRHIEFFEGLLQDEENEFVQTACGEGKLALAYNCPCIPDVLLDVEGCFGVRRTAPERPGAGFIRAYIGQSCLAQPGIGVLDFAAGESPRIDIPRHEGAWYEGYFQRQLQAKLITPLSDALGIDFSDEKLCDAIARRNELCRIIAEMGDMQWLDVPLITGYEFLVIQLAAQSCPRYLLADKLRETLEELKTREADEQPDRPAILLLAGGPHHPELAKLAQACGAAVMVAPFCLGALPGRGEITLEPGERPLAAIARHYLSRTRCPRIADGDNAAVRGQYIRDLCASCKADGIIFDGSGCWDDCDRGLPCPVPVFRVARDGGSLTELRPRLRAFIQSLEQEKLPAGA